jgi:hypothetical protein
VELWMIALVAALGVTTWLLYRLAVRLQVKK